MSAPRTSIEWVRQEDSYGCVVATCAMLTGRTYREMKDFFVERSGDPDIGLSSKNGLTHYNAEFALHEAGYWAQLKYRWYLNNQERPAWPPEPWAPVHYCQVVVRGGSGAGHAVVMLADGTVLDPVAPEPHRLEDYEKVSLVIGLVQT